MFINKSKSGTNNLCGDKIAFLRTQMDLSQRELAVILQTNGLDVTKNTVQRIEAGKGFITDIELVAFSAVLGISVEELLS